MLERRKYEIAITLGDSAYLPHPVHMISDYDHNELMHPAAAGNVNNMNSAANRAAFLKNSLGYMQHKKLMNVLNEYKQCEDFAVASTTPAAVTMTTNFTAVTLHAAYDDIAGMVGAYNSDVMGDLAPAVPADWVANRVYNKGDRVTQGGTYYAAKDKHSNGTFTAGEWDIVLLEPTAYVGADAYVVDEMVKYNNKYYKCIVATNAASFDADAWQEITAKEAGIEYDEVNRVLKYIVSEAFKTQDTTYVDENGDTQTISSIKSDDYLVPTLVNTPRTVINATGGKEAIAATAQPQVLTYVPTTLPTNDSITVVVKEIGRTKV